MPRLIDLTGKKVGRLTVREYLGSGMWFCDCDCGNTKIAKGVNLRRGDTKSCGCLSRGVLIEGERAEFKCFNKKPQYKDLSGMRFGSLTVVETCGKRGTRLLWRCVCDCGADVVLTARQLNDGSHIGCNDCMSFAVMNSLPDREWRPITEYENLYAVSDHGEVFSYQTCKLLKPARHDRGYLAVELYKDGKHSRAYVHRLTACAFLDNSDNLPEVNHIDGNKRNNCVDNLEWVTPRENYDHAVQHELYQRGEDRHNSKLTADDVRYIRKNCIKFDPEVGIKPIAARLGVSDAAVGAILRGNNWKWVE